VTKKRRIRAGENGEQAMPPRVTVRDIAREVGLHFTTVARALNNHPRLPPATRQLVQDAAARLGYTPDPMLTALNAYRKTVRRPRYQATLAWIDNWPKRHLMFKYGEFREYHAGALKRASELGYHLDEFWLHEAGMTPAKLRRVLKARNIQGVIMPPQELPNTTIDFDMTGFAGVALGYTLASPALDVVTNHQFRTMLLVLRHLDLLGYRRVAVCINREWNEKVGFNWKAAMNLAPDITDERLQVFRIMTDNPRSVIDEARAMDADVIVGHSYMRARLESVGMSFPCDIGFASLSVFEDDPHTAGAAQSNHLIGRTAVDLVVDRLHRNAHGIPQLPAHTLIDSVWQSGATLRAHIVSPPRERPPSVLRNR
jgi:LacI family transcriptional regulator